MVRQGGILKCPMAALFLAAVAAGAQEGLINQVEQSVLKRLQDLSY
jgi:hypothetical protein